MELSELISLVSSGTDLSFDLSVEAGNAMTLAEVLPEDKAAFLTALAKKGETSDEVAGFVSRFRELARNPGLERWSGDAIDVCGTGGDKLGTFNISTTVTFVLAAAGVPVLKHGNKSITSKCGSANLLEALGVSLTAPDEVLAKSMEELGFCFMFAPAFHPAFKEIMPVRQLLAKAGQRTIFNILGPLINPAQPAHQLLGVFGPQLLGLMGDTLHKVGLKSGLVAHCQLGESKGMDEFSVAGMNMARGFGALNAADDRWMAEDFGLKTGPLCDLEGGDIEENVGILNALLDGKAPAALEDTVCLNAAAAFFVVGKHPSIRDGIGEARELLLGGAVKGKISDSRTFYSDI